ncbi:ABC transporter permease [Clostridium hydrogeniformans]|uniref:ABC transporter permease n=1 Tax=Clostridium hydrogeniformans TaxID=349933 RepID=UPI0004854C45|nr:FtsX-like permease family protein [Clostridium hydrogeniformans]
MRILFRFLLNNIIEKKLRVFLIVITVAVATAMCFASLGVSSSYSEMVKERMKSKIGEANIIILGNNKGMNSILDRDKVNEATNNYKRALIFDGEGTYENKDDIVKINIKATDLEDLNYINPIILSNESKGFNLKDIQDNKVVVSKKFSEKNNLKLGDKLTVTTEKKQIFLEVGAIAINKGFLSEDPGEATLVMDNHGLSKALDRPSIITSTLIDAKDKNVNEVIKELKEDLKEYEILETISKESLDNMVSQFTLPFYIMLIVVFLMAGFIIFSAYKVIILERMAVIGTLRSIGATKLSTDLIMLIESFIYGTLGGILGNALGIPILYYLADSSNQFKQYGVETIVNIDKFNFLIAFLLALFLCIISSVIPIISASKLYLKDIILGTFSQNSKTNFGKLIVGLVLTILPYIYIQKYRWTGSFILSILGAFSIFIGMIFLCSYIIRIFYYIFKEIYRFIFGNEGVIALENISKSKVLINNCALLICTLAAVVAIYVASFSVNKLIVSGYSNLHYDAQVKNPKNREVIDKIKELEYIKNTYEELNLNEIDVKGKDFKIKSLQGIEKEKFKEFYSNVNIYDNSNKDKEEILEELDKDSNIIVSHLLSKKQGLEIGESISLKIGEEYRDYKITGFAESEFIDNSQGALVSLENLKKDYNKEVGNTLKIQGNIKDLSKTLKKDLKDYGISISEKSEDLKNNIEANRGIMKSLESFSLMSLVIGSLGMMNNFMVSFIYRKREFSVLASVGMSKYQRGKLILIEGITIGLIGGLLGVLEGVYISKFIGEITYSLDTYITISYPIKLIVALGILGALLVIIASLIPMVKSSKLSIVEEIKYE